MGLDVTAYSKLELDKSVTFDMDGEPSNIGDDWWDTHAYIRPDGHFHERADGLERGYYRYANKAGWRAGSYGGYNRWREWLAKLAGYPLTDFDPGDGRAPDKSHAAATWGSDGVTGPFSELINFSDAEGVIGPQTSAKLARDFAEWDERARADCFNWQSGSTETMDFNLETERFPGARDNYSLYRKWRSGFELAANGGAVDFH